MSSSTSARTIWMNFHAADVSSVHSAELTGSMTRLFNIYLIINIGIALITPSIDNQFDFPFSTIAWRWNLSRCCMSCYSRRFIVTSDRYRGARRVGWRPWLRLLCHHWCRYCNGCPCCWSVVDGTIMIVGTVVTSWMQVFRYIFMSDVAAYLICCSLSSSIHCWCSWHLIVWPS